jgi:hypothetical protein
MSKISRKITWLIIFNIFLCLNIFSQDSLTFKTLHYVAFQTGYSRHIVKDDIISPLVYRGSQIPVSFNYQFFSGNSIQSISLFFDNLNLTSSITIHSPAEAFYTINYNAFINYSYCLKLYSFSRWNISVFAGGEIKSLLNLRDHYYNNYTHYNTGEFVSDLGFSFLIIKRFASSQNDLLSFRYSMSIVAYDMLNYLYNANVAKKMSTDAGQNTFINLIKAVRPVTINNYFEFQTEISYTKFINKFIGFELKQYFQYYNEKKFDELLYTKYVNNQYLVGLIIKF